MSHDREVYATQKALYHRDSMDALIAGKQPYPKHIELVISDFCNHDCFPAGTLVYSPGGDVPIEGIKKGDRVYGPDGKVLTVTATGGKWADELYEIRCGSRIVRCSADHPFLTEYGWMQAKHLRVGDSTAMRLWMWGKSIKNKKQVDKRAQSPKKEPCHRSHRNSPSMRMWVRRNVSVESALQKMGVIYPGASAFSGHNEIQPENMQYAPDAVRRRNASSLQMWLLRASEEISSAMVLDGLHWGTSAEEGVGALARIGTSSIGAYEEEQPDERSCRSSKSAEELCRSIFSVEVGNEVRRVGYGAEFASAICRRWGVVGKQEEPGHEGYGAEKGFGDIGNGYLQLNDRGRTDSDHVRTSANTALREVGMEMSGGIQERSQEKIAREAGGSDTRICIEGIELVRGMGLQSIDSIRRIKGRVRLYNLECPPTHAYIANGFSVSNCGFCSYRMSGHPSNTFFQLEEGTDRKARNPKRMIPVEKCLEILDDCAEMGVKAIQFTGGGEPTIHPDFCRIVAHAMQKGLETALITNGNMMLEDDQRTLAKRMTWLRISIDAAHPEHYMAERGVGRGAWDRMIEGATLLCREAKTENPSLVIGSGFVVTPRNFSQIYEAARLYKSIGFHNMRIGLMFNPEDEKPFVEFWPEIRRQASEAVRDFSCSEFRVTDRTQERFDEFAGKGDGVIDYPICGFQNFTNFIGGDQNVYRCCMWAFHPRGLMGSIKNQHLKELYDSPEKHLDFAGFDPKGCGKCQFNQTNKAINAAIVDPSILDRIGGSKLPMHHNFI